MDRGPARRGRGHHPGSQSEWGVEQFTGRDPTGKAIELSVYGRDASDARVLAKLWRFAIYRDSGPTLIMDRLQQVEHEAYLTLMAERAGASSWTAP